MNPDSMCPVYLETVKKRSFAGALDWPGWCRGGRDDASALQSLLDYAPRYARVLESTDLAFKSPGTLKDFDVIEHLTGDSTTEFGAPGKQPSADALPVDEADLQRLLTTLLACRCYLEKTVLTAQGKELRKGPRGGGRELDEILRHVYAAEAAYLSRIGVKLSPGEAAHSDYTWQAVQDSLVASVRGLLPERGPRGGLLWQPRYFVRRFAWHILDHAWEIEDRTQ